MPEPTFEPVAASLPIGYQIAIATSESYPMNAPYRAPRQGEAWTAKIPRILMLTLSTLANTVNDAWDENSRTLTFRPTVFDLRKRFGVGDAGLDRSRFRSDLEFLVERGYPSSHDGMIPAVEQFTMKGKTLRNASVTFTEQFADMLTHDPRQVKMNTIEALNGQAMLFDLLMLGVLYCPRDRRLLIPHFELPNLLPASSPATYQSSNIKNRVTELNRLQNEWKFAFIDDLLEIKEHGLNDAPALRLSARQGCGTA